MIKFLFVALLALSASASFAQPPDELDARLRTAEIDGATIYRLDQAAALATDAARKLKEFRRDKRVEGWLAEDKGGTVLVTFYGNDIRESQAALYRVVIPSDGKAVAEALGPGIPLTERQTTQAAVRSLALHSDFNACSKNYNPVVLPRPDGSWSVYLLTGTTQAGVIPAGGNYRVDIDSTGKTILASRGFTKSCIELKDTKRTVSLMLTHLLDPTPTEIHVFLNLLAGKSIYLMTTENSSVWAIEKGKIRFVQKMEPEN